MKKLVMFTDLDGTLLDHETYSFDKALPALRLVAEKGVPLVICSSKTRAEIEHYRDRLSNRHPFVSENGGGIFVPKGYFKTYADVGLNVEDESGYLVVRLGARYSELRKAVEELRREGFAVRGFGDMSVSEVASLAGMDLAEAEMARERDFDEPFVFEGGEDEIPGLVEAIRAKGLSYTRGRFHHVMGGSDKGRAVTILADLYRKEFGDVRTVAIGDSPNDLPMLERADVPVVVQKPGGIYDEALAGVPGVIKAGGVGPLGWDLAVMRLLKARGYGPAGGG